MTSRRQVNHHRRCIVCLPSTAWALHQLSEPQVEMKRLGIPAETPCAVQQWEGLIAGAPLLPLQLRLAPVRCIASCSTLACRARLEALTWLPCLPLPVQSITLHAPAASHATCG